jgi:hypothetical protein
MHDQQIEKYTQKLLRDRTAVPESIRFYRLDDGPNRGQFFNVGLVCPSTNIPSRSLFEAYAIEET